MAQSITSNAIYNVLLNVASVIFPIITAPYVARVLEPDGIGLNSFANTYASYFALVALLGIPTYGVREVSKVRDDKEAISKLMSQLMSIAAITTVGVSAIYLTSIAVINQLTENYVIFFIAGFVVYLAPFKINWYYQGVENFGFVTKVSLIIRTLSVICLFLFVRDKSDLVIYVILGVLGGVFADVWNFVKMWRSGIHLRFTFKGLRQHINPLLILFASSIAISIYTVLDTLMLGFITDYEEVGYYSNAMHLSKIILTAVTSLSIVAVPRVSYYMKNRDYDNITVLITKSFSAVSFIAFPVAIGLSCISPTFIPLFFGEKFVGSIIPLMILSFLILSIGLNNLTGVQVLIGMGYDKLFLYSVLFGTITNFAMNCLLIPLCGATGASIASVTAETLILVITTFYVYSKTPIRIGRWKDMLKSFVGSVVFIPLVYCLGFIFEGWLLVAFFCFLGFVIYVFIEALLKNSALELFLSVITKKINIKNGNC